MNTVQLREYVLRLQAWCVVSTHHDESFSMLDWCAYCFGLTTSPETDKQITKSLTTKKKKYSRLEVIELISTALRTS